MSMKKMFRDQQIKGKKALLAAVYRGKLWMPHILPNMVLFCQIHGFNWSFFGQRQYKNPIFHFFSNFESNTGFIYTLVGPHAARGTSDWDPWFTAIECYFKRTFWFQPRFSNQCNHFVNTLHYSNTMLPHAVYACIRFKVIFWFQPRFGNNCNHFENVLNCHVATYCFCKHLP